MLASRNREITPSQRTDSESHPVPDGGVGGGGEACKHTECRTPLFSSGNSSRHFGVHGGWLGGFVLSAGHAITRFPFLLRHAVCYGRSGLDLLRMSFCQHGRQLGRPDSRGLHFLRKGSPGHYAREGTSC